MFELVFNPLNASRNVYLVREGGDEREGREREGGVIALMTVVVVCLSSGNYALAALTIVSVSKLREMVKAERAKLTQTWNTSEG